VECAVIEKADMEGQNGPCHDSGQHFGRRFTATRRKF
jgi:hypothetical protein